MKSISRVVIGSVFLMLGLQSATANTVISGNDGVINPNDFSIVETVTPLGGRYAVFNNSSKYFIEDFYVTHSPDAHSPSTTEPGWRAFSMPAATFDGVPIGPSFEYFVNLRVSPGIGPGQSSDLFFFSALVAASDFVMYVHAPGGNLIGIYGQTSDAASTVPIPGAFVLFATGVAGLGWLVRRRKTKQAA